MYLSSILVQSYPQYVEKYVYKKDNSNQSCLFIIYCYVTLSREKGLTRSKIYFSMLTKEEYIMDLVEHIKNFLAQQGLNWNGEIEYEIKKNHQSIADFRMARAEDFEKEGDTQTIIIDFGKLGQIALVVSINLINFRIEGTAPEYGFTCYAGDNDENVKLCEERDLSQEWLEYMLVNGGLVYRTALIKLCAEKKKLAELSLDNTQKLIDREIEKFQRQREIARRKCEAKISNISKLEEKAKNF